MKQIVIATDGSQERPEAMDFGLELPREKVQGSRSCTSFRPTSGSSPAEALLATQSRTMSISTSEIALSEAVDAAEGAGVTYALERISGDAADEIVAVADAKNAPSDRRRLARPRAGHVSRARECLEERHEPGEAPRARRPLRGRSRQGDRLIRSFT